MSDEVDWVVACDGVPSHDFLEGLREDGSVSLAVEDFNCAIQRRMFVMWEGVIRMEQGLALSHAEKEAVHSLRCFEDDEHVHYIDGLSRPRKPWYHTLNTLAEALLLDRVDTVDGAARTHSDAWRSLQDVLDLHGGDLRLQPGVGSPIEAVPDPTRWRLGLQSCLCLLCGIGQHPELTLADADVRRRRLRDFLDELVDNVDSVRALNLTLAQLLASLAMPRREKRLLEKALRTELALTSSEDPLAGRLEVRRQSDGTTTAAH
jgi:hypothetical protein